MRDHRSQFRPATIRSQCQKSVKLAHVGSVDCQTTVKCLSPDVSWWVYTPPDDESIHATLVRDATAREHAGSRAAGHSDHAGHRVDRHGRAIGARQPHACPRAPSPTFRNSPPGTTRSARSTFINLGWYFSRAVGRIAIAPSGPDVARLNKTADSIAKCKCQVALAEDQGSPDADRAAGRAPATLASLR